MKKLSLKALIWLALILLIVWFFRPFFHSFAMMFWVSPLRAILIIALLVGIVLFFKRLGKISFVQTGMQNYSLKASNKISPLLVFGYIAGLVILLIALNFESEIRYLITSKQVDYETKADLPGFDPIRLTPKPVAERYADDTFQNPQEHLGDSQIIMKDGKLLRVYPRLPDGGLLFFLNKLGGFVTVEVDTLDRKVSIEDKQFKYSEGIGVFDNIDYQLLKKKYFVSYSSEPIYLKNDQGEWVTLVPYISYKSFPFRVPYWGGVMEVKADGMITNYSPEEAQNISYMKNNRLYPKELVSYYTDSYSYKGGLLNKWFLHKNQIETVGLQNSEKIIHASTTEGFKQIVVAEPYGRSYGIYKIFIFDATSGKREVIEYDQNSQLTGPVAAADYIKREFPTYSWDAFSLSEPRPLKIEGDLYWLLSIIPNDAAGIAKTVLFNAKTNKVTGFDNIETFNDFLKTGEVTPTTPTATTQPTSVSATADNAQIKAKIDEIQNQLDALKNLVQ